MNTKDFLDIVCRQVKYKPANKMIFEELEGHIEDLKNENLCKGYTNEKAEKKAIKQMGDAKKIGKKLNKIHRPKLDWITLIFMLTLLIFGGQFKILFQPKEYLIENYSLIYIELILGVLFGIFIYFYDYRKICKHSNLLYIIATSLNIVAYFRGFRANGNLIYGLYPFATTSPTVFSIPIYIIAFAGFINNVSSDTKTNITTSNGKKINYNVLKLMVLGCLAVITSLMINFISGFFVAIVYTIMSARELIKRKQIKNTFMLLVTATTLFLLLSMIICIIPTKNNHMWDKYTSAFWVGADTVGERRNDFVRNKIFESAELLGQANLQDIPLEDEQGYISSIQYYFGINGIFAFLGILSEYGWIASFCFIAIITLFNLKLIHSALKIKDAYGKLITIGIACLFIVQTICNLAMNFGIVGTAEIQLPLISGGKATFIANFLCMVLFLSVYRRQDINFEEPQKSKLIIKIENFLFEEI